MGRREFHFATAAMREGRMLGFTRLVAACCFALAGAGVIVQFAPAGPHGVVHRSLQAAVAVSAVVVGLWWLLGPWPRYRHAVAFVVWADGALSISAITMSTPHARLGTTLYRADRHLRRPASWRANSAGALLFLRCAYRGDHRVGGARRP